MPKRDNDDDSKYSEHQVNTLKTKTSRAGLPDQQHPQGRGRNEGPTAAQCRLAQSAGVTRGFRALVREMVAQTTFLNYPGNSFQINSSRQVKVSSPTIPLVHSVEGKIGSPLAVGALESTGCRRNQGVLWGRTSTLFPHFLVKAGPQRFRTASEPVPGFRRTGSLHW